MGDHARDSFLFLHVLIINKQNRDRYNKYTMFPLIFADRIKLAEWQTSGLTFQVAVC
jgi:hypothetical protein